MTGCSLTRLKDEHRSRASLIQGRIWQLPIGRACPSPDFSFVLTNVPTFSGSFITGAERWLLKQESLGGGEFHCFLFVDVFYNSILLSAMKDFS